MKTSRWRSLPTKMPAASIVARRPSGPRDTFKVGSNWSAAA